MEKLKKYFKESPLTASFLTIMLAYYIFLSLKGGSSNNRTLLEYGAFFPPFVAYYGEYYRFISSIFIHIGISHLICNGYALFILGPLMEKIMGPIKYLIFFLLTGIAGNLLSYFFNFEVISAGASGSLFGLFGCLVYLIMKYKDLVPKAIKKDIISLVVFNLALTFIVPSISISAHLGGFISGFILSFIFIK